MDDAALRSARCQIGFAGPKGRVPQSRIVTCFTEKSRELRVSRQIPPGVLVTLRLTMYEFEVTRT